MARNTLVTAKNLEELGAGRLAELLVEISAADAGIKRRLRLELAGRASPKELAAAIRKRLATIARSQSFIDWQTRRAAVDDLETQRRAIVEQLAQADPAEALDLLWRFVGLAEGVFARSDDSSGDIGDVFDTAIADLGQVALAANADPTDLANRVHQALLANGYGQFDRLIATLAPSLGAAGLDHLKRRMRESQREPARKRPDAKGPPVAWSSHGPLYADDFEHISRETTVGMALRDIADAQGDVEGYIATYDAGARGVPSVAARIATRLLAAGRAPEALRAIEAARPERSDWINDEWQNARIAALEAVGRADDAQTARWQRFEHSLDSGSLRDYLKRLPDFEDVEAEQRALASVGQHRSLLDALAFLIAWPALEQAAALVLARQAELDGNRYEVLSPAADALAGRHPLAATLLLRAMIGFTLDHARSSRYRHAARHLADCAGLAAAIADFGAIEPHDAYIARLRAAHGRKAAFWSLVA